jgi:signal transduction histidine kinase
MHQVEVNPLDFLILVVDDSKPNVVLLSHVLKEAGFRVEKSYDGDEALDKVKECSPDLILMDIMMPKKSGIEVGFELGKTKYKDTPIIFLSSTNETVDKLKAFESGGVDFINKPFDKDELLVRVRNHLMIKTLGEEKEQQLQILKEREIELSEANQKKHKLMRMLSHDIKNPISGIMGLVSILLEDDSLDEEERNEMLGLIKQSSDKLLELVKEQLDKEVIGSSSEILSKEKVDILDLARQAIKNNQPKAVLKKIKIELHTTNKSIPIVVDPKKILQVFNTLISNAVKFTTKERLVKIEFDTKDEKLLLIKIIDFGIGIPNTMLPNFLISSRKEQEENPKQILGVGLGLEEVREYVEAHMGKIWVKSTENVGTTFFIELPFEKNI